MRITRFFTFLFALLIAFPLFAQDRAAGLQLAQQRAQHLRHGINASEWFAQSAQDYTARRTNRYTDDGDIALMAKLGFDNVRLSIDPVPLEQGFDHEGPYADFLSRLDHVVDTMLANGLAVQIDIHPESSYKQRVRESNDGVERFVMLWRRLAAHYADRNPDLIFYEIMNEPEVTDPYRWAGIQAHAAAAIRAVAPKNTIIATGGSWSAISELLPQHPLPDGNVIYTFHFYEPHEFTHQGASWGGAWWIYTHDIPYPPTAESMDASLKQVPDLRDRYDFEHYWLDHWDAERIKLQMDAAAAWSKANGGVPLICNEFGVYRRVTPETSRMQWIHDVRTALEADGIGWTMWDYRGGFGVVFKEDGKPARIDQKVVEALGLHSK
ncbi:MAG TPA: cellulase family glycosylhydrolase [Terracidiphilus sp.]|jgi:aryl-phospho-beta-D-glucosidase BglC (GH1 family)